MAVDLRTRQSKDVTEGSSPRFVPPRSLLFVRGALESGSASLFVADFDPKTLSLSGEPSVVVGDVGVNIEGTSHYSVPNLTHLAYVPTPGRVLRVLDPAGTVRKTIPLNESADMVAVAANGRKAVVALGSQLQVVDLSSGVAERLTYDPGRYKFPAWSHDSRRVSYRFQRVSEAAFRIMVIDAAGGAPREVGKVNADPDTGGISTWMPDGSALIGNHRGPRGDHDLLRRCSTEKATSSRSRTRLWRIQRPRGPGRELLAFLCSRSVEVLTSSFSPCRPAAQDVRCSPQSNCTIRTGVLTAGSCLQMLRPNLRGHPIAASRNPDCRGAEFIAERPLRGGLCYGVLPGGGL